MNKNNFQKKLKKAYYKYHKKLLKQQYLDSKLPKQFQTVSAVEGFITYLRYLRDQLFITEIKLADYNSKQFEGSVILNLLTMTIEEYELSQSCISKYFNVDFDNLHKKNLSEILSVRTTDGDNSTSFEQAQDNYVKEWQQHWNRFWELAAKCVDLNIYGTTL